MLMLGGGSVGPPVRGSVVFAGCTFTVLLWFQVFSLHFAVSFFFPFSFSFPFLSYCGMFFFLSV